MARSGAQIEAIQNQARNGVQINRNQGAGAKVKAQSGAQPRETVQNRQPCLDLRKGCPFDYPMPIANAGCNAPNSKRASADLYP